MQPGLRPFNLRAYKQSGSNRSIRTRDRSETAPPITTYRDFARSCDSGLEMSVSA